MSDTLKNEIAELAGSVLASTDFFLLEIKISGGNNPEISLYVDGKQRGINMDECAEISNDISFLIEAHELISGAYRINVSSPGLSRPLSDKRQYGKNVGRKVKVKFKNEQNEYIKTEGVLASHSDEAIVIRGEEDEEHTIAFSRIVETKVIPSIN